MKTYVICIQETISDEFSIVAENEKRALEIAKEKYMAGKIVLEPGYVNSTEMAIISPEEMATEWIEF